MEVLYNVKEPRVADDDCIMITSGICVKKKSEKPLKLGRGHSQMKNEFRYYGHVALQPLSR